MWKFNYSTSAKFRKYQKNEASIVFFSQKKYIYLEISEFYSW